MKIAAKAVKEEALLRKTAGLYNIHVMTLSDYVKKSIDSRTVIFDKMGRNPVFTEEQENEIKDHIPYLSRKFYGVTPLFYKTSRSDKY